MKRISLILALLLLVDVGFRLLTPSVAAAQSSGTFVMLQVGTPQQCAWPAGATFTNAMALCATTSGLYYATNGNAAFVPVSGAGGVTSFNGRTGAVVSAASDYSYAQLSGKPSGLVSITGGSLTGTIQ